MTATDEQIKAFDAGFKAAIAQVRRYAGCITGPKSETVVWFADNCASFEPQAIRDVMGGGDPHKSRCCLGLSEDECAWVPSKQCTGLDSRCKKCGGIMEPGKALAETVVGKVIDCMKCDACGHSVTMGGR